MTRTKAKFNEVVSMDNLRKAYYMASQGKHNYKEVKEFEKDVEGNLLEIQKMLIEERYRVSPYSSRVVLENGKKRVINKLPFYPDRIIQWAIMLPLQDMFHKHFVNHTCASVPGKGIDYARRLTRKYVNLGYPTRYCLKIDIKKFYDNIDHWRLKEFIMRKIRDGRLEFLIFNIIDSYFTNDTVSFRKTDVHYLRDEGTRFIGLPIGSYLSQYLANFYLSFFDHYLKEVLRLKYVVRYMDDIVVFHHDKKYLHDILRDIRASIFLMCRLRLKDNYQIFSTDVRGVDFVGFRFFRRFTLLRKSTALKFKRLARRVYKLQSKNKMISHHLFCAVFSYLGLLQRCNGYRLFKKYFLLIKPALVWYYKKNLNKDPRKIIKFKKHFQYKYKK